METEETESNNNNKYLIITILSVIVPIILYFVIPRNNTQVLSEEVVATSTEEPTPTPTETPTPTPSPSPTPKPTKTPTPIPTPSPIPPAEINALIDRFSAQYGVDPNVMRHIAICESGFNPLAKTRYYAGLYQFGQVTWQNIRREIGEDLNINLRYSAEESAQTAAYALSKGKRGIWPNCAP